MAEEGPLSHKPSSTYLVEAETIFDVPANGIYYANLVVIGVPIIPPTNRNSAKLLP
jgi:hypothetical protein